MKLSDHERATSTVTLSDDQFAKLVELLTPGYEVAKLYLADYHRTSADHAPIGEGHHDDHHAVDGGVIT
jgi:hypothetical protein